VKKETTMPIRGRALARVFTALTFVASFGAQTTRDVPHES